MVLAEAGMSPVCHLPDAAGPHTGLDVHNVTHAISVRDLVSDTVHQFAPTYHDYVLYSNSGAKSAPKVRPCAPQLGWSCPCNMHLSGRQASGCQYKA